MLLGDIHSKQVLWDNEKGFFSKTGKESFWT
jgi:hypothetical protein